MTIDPRRPNAAPASPDRIPHTESFAPVKLPAGVLAKVGESFAVALSALQRLLATLEPLATGQQSVLTAALAEVARLEQLGLQIQELARVLARDAPVVPERLDLARAARQAMAEWAATARRLGVRLAGPREPFELDVNAAVLEQLLDLGLEYALHIGSGVEVSAGSQGLPPHPVLTIRVQRRQPSSGRAEEDDLNEIHWLLFVQLARAMGLEPQRTVTAQTVTLRLGFPATGTSAVGDGDVGAALLPRTAPAAGHRVLLIEPHEMARVHAHQLMRDVGMRVDAVTNLERAHACLRDGVPDVVVTGIPVSDRQCEALLTEIRAAQPRLRVIELVDDNDAFAISVPGSDSPARVGRHDLARTLMSALSQELDAAWPT
jgi:CheY-like chemotaxis protein